MSEAFLEGLQVTGIGLVVVFSVLAILIVCIELLHLVMKGTVKTATPAKETAPAPVLNTKRISSGVMATVPEAENAPQDPEFLAAVSTVISVYSGKPQNSFVIKSIKNK